MSEMSRLPDLSAGERDQLCRARARSLWELVAEMPEPYRHTTLFELVKLWVEQIPDDLLVALAADLHGQARHAEQKMEGGDDLMK